tara:strand:+ start:529 stop:1125 length:597 start_codon:yes stop_codon:yes gene_type:complete
MEETKQYINKYLLPIIIESGEKLEGNIFMNHRTTKYTNKFINKIKNIETISSNKGVEKVLEIGFNSGFSSLLMLFSNPNLTITCLDLCRHKYTIPCYEQIKKTFKNRINLISGDSTKTIHNISDTFDLIHIDGGHSVRVASADIQNSLRLSKSGTTLIMDDYDITKLKSLWDKIISGIYHKKIKIHESKYHDIIRLGY